MWCVAPASPARAMLSRQIGQGIHRALDATAGHSAAQQLLLPLIADLDGMLLLSDTLDEQIAEALFHRPLHLGRALPDLGRGRAALQRAMPQRSISPLPPCPSAITFWSGCATRRPRACSFTYAPLPHRASRTS